MKNYRTATILATALFTIANFNTGWAKSTEHKIKDLVDDAADSLKRGVDQCGENIAKIEQKLKEAVQEEASAGAVSLRHLELNGGSRVAVVQPKDPVNGVVLCSIDRDKCSALGVYRVVLGIQGKGAQTTIGNELGLVAGESLEKFTLTAPEEPGIYQIRFRLVDRILEGSALKAWVDEGGNEPGPTSTIGIIFVVK